MPRFQTDRYGGGIVHVLAPNPGRDAAVPSAGQQVAFVIQHGQHRTLQVIYRHYSEVALAGMYVDAIERLRIDMYRDSMYRDIIEGLLSLPSVSR